MNDLIICLSHSFALNQRKRIAMAIDLDNTLKPDQHLLFYRWGNLISVNFPVYVQLLLPNHCQKQTVPRLIPILSP